MAHVQGVVSRSRQPRRIREGASTLGGSDERRDERRDLRRCDRRGLPRRRRVPGVPDRHSADHRRGSRGHVRARSDDDRRRGAAGGELAPPAGAPARRSSRAGAVPQGLRPGLVGPAPRDDGRPRSTGSATRTSRASATTRSRRHSCSACAARRATRSITPRASVRHRDHSKQVFVDKVDVVSAPGYDRARRGRRGHRVATRSAASCRISGSSTSTLDNRMRLVSVHPGVTVDQILEITSSSWSSTERSPSRASPRPTSCGCSVDVIDPKATRKELK